MGGGEAFERKLACIVTEIIAKFNFCKTLFLMYSNVMPVKILNVY